MPGKPPQSNKQPSRKQMAQMAEAAALGLAGPGGDTFLTDMLVGGKQQAKQNAGATRK